MPDNPSCPRCGHYNAMLEAWDAERGLFHRVCRDCGHNGDEVVTAASAAATECREESSEENTMSKQISNTPTTTSAKAAKPTATVKDESKQSALAAYRAKRAAKLAELNKTDPLKASMSINFREYREVMKASVNPESRSYKAYCEYMANACRVYWTAEAAKPAPVNTKRLDAKKAQLAKLIATRAKLEAELKALGIDIEAEVGPIVRANADKK